MEDSVYTISWAKENILCLGFLCAFYISFVVFEMILKVFLVWFRLVLLNVNFHYLIICLMGQNGVFKVHLAHTSSFWWIQTTYLFINLCYMLSIFDILCFMLCSGTLF